MWFGRRATGSGPHRRACERARPLEQSLGGHDPEFQHAVADRASGNTLTPPTIWPRLPSRMQVVVPSYQWVPSTWMSPQAVAAEVARPAPGCGAAHPLLGSSPRGSWLRRSRLRPSRGSVPPRSARRRAGGDVRAGQLRPHPRYRLVSEVRRERFAVPAGTTARLVLVPASVSTQRRTVPSPPQAKTITLVQGALNLLGRFLAFGTSYQSGSSTPSVASTRAREPAVELLRRVGDDGDLHATPGAYERRWAWSSWRRASRWPRQPRGWQRQHEQRPDMTRPPATSSGWCIPRYMRERRGQGSRSPTPRRRRAERESETAR